MDNYKKIDADDLAFLRSAVGENAVLVNDESLQTYSRDYTEDFSFPPEVVVLPSSTDQVSQILKYCDDHKIPVTPRGAGTGLSGGALPFLLTKYRIRPAQNRKAGSELFSN